MANYLQENIYYNSTLLNTTSAQIPAEQDDRLLNPIINNSGNFNVMINQAKIPIGTIPLKQTNIDFHAYEVTLQQTLANGEVIQASAFVPQIGGNRNSFLYNISPQNQITKYQYNQTTGALTTISTLFVGDLINGPPIQLVCDEFENYYILNGLSQNIITVINQVGVILTELVLTNSTIQCLAIDPVDNLYIGVESAIDGSSVLIYENDNSPTLVTLIPAGSITQGPNGVPLSGINTVCADQSILVGYERNNFAIYDAVNLALVSSYQDTAIIQLSNSSQILSDSNSFAVVDTGAINDIFLGFPIGGAEPTQLENMIGGASWISSLGFNGSSAYLSGNDPADNLGYIVGSNNQTYSYTPYKTPGSPATLVNSTTQISTGGVVRAGFQNGFVGKVNLSTVLTGFNTDNQYANDYFSLANDFAILAGGSPVSVSEFDIQGSTNKIFAIGTDNILYQSAVGFCPKQFFIDDSKFRVGNANTGFQWVGAGWLDNPEGLPSTAFPLNNLQISSPNSSVLDWGACNPDDGYVYILRAGGGYCAVGQWQLPNLNITNAQTPVGVSTDASSYSFAMANSITYGTLTAPWMCISDQTRTIHLQDYLGSHPMNFLIPDAVGTSNIQIATYQGKIGATTVQYLAVVNTSKLYVFNITDPAGVITVLDYELTLNDLPVQGFGVVMCNNQIWFTAIVPGIPTPSNALFYITYTVDGTGQFINVTNNFLGDSPSGAPPMNTNINVLSYNETQKEVYILGTNSQIMVYNTTIIPPTITAFIEVSGNLNTAQSNYFMCFQNLDHLYNGGTWTQVNTASNAVKSIGISKNNPNNFYLTYNSNNLVYKGLYQSATPSITNLTRFQPITGTYNISAIIPEAEATVNYKVYSFSISNQTPLANSPKVYGTTVVSGIARNSFNSSTINQTYGISKQGVGMDYLNATNLSLASSSTLTSANLAFILNGSDINAGPVQIYDMAVLINGVNLAFTDALNKLISQGSTFHTEPSVSLNYETGLVTLNYTNQYPIAGNGIIFNTALLALIYFLNTPLSNNTGGTLILPPSSTSITQNSRTIYLFNNLDQILFESQSLYVQGTYFSVVSTSRIITDIGVDTSSIVNNIGQIVIYNPFVLRSFKMNSNLPVNRIHMRILYQYKDGTSYPLVLDPGANFFVKLNFINKT